MVMGTHQCLFFLNGLVEYWENVTADGDVSIEALLEDMLAQGNWHSAEAWRDDMLVCRVMQPGGPLYPVASASTPAQ